MIVRLCVEPTGDVVQCWLAAVGQENAEPRREGQKLDAETLALIREKLEEILRHPESPHFARELRSVGEQLYRLLLPPAVRAELAEVSGPVLVETPLVGIPWDLLHDGDDFLGLKLALGVRPHVREQYDVASPPPAPGPPRVLLIGSDPRGDLCPDPEGESSIDLEIRRLAARLRHTTDLHVLNRHQAEFHAVASFLGEGFDVVHYCGHVVRAPDGEPALLLADEVFLKASFIQSVVQGRPLVFVSGCASGRDLARAPEPRWGRLLGGVADGFLLGGARAVVATHCNVHDLVAPQLAEEFYVALLEGHGVGEALRSARAGVRSRHPESSVWLSFALIGNPTLRLDPQAGGFVDGDAPSARTVSQRGVFMLTDIAAASTLRSRLGITEYARRAAVHDRLFRTIVKSVPGARLLRDLGDGFMARFETASAAVEAGLRFQRALATEQWDADGFRARLSVDLGEAAEVDAGEPGRAKVVSSTDLAARTMDLALPGQILLTRAAFDETRAHPFEQPSAAPVALRWIAHGQYVMKGIDEPIELFEVGEPGIAPLATPPDTDRARRRLEDEDLLGWRPAVGAAIPSRESWILDERLGAGGFGEVWLAHRNEDGERRVFKFCFDARHLRSFRRELRILNLLRDELGACPDIARLYDVQLARPPYFLESEHAPGGNLTQWAARKGGIATLSLDARLDLFARTATALARAHSVGVLHRDLKPSNILIYEADDGSPRPCLSDFGIGLVTDRTRLRAQPGGPGEPTSRTEDGEEPGRIGTRPYQPPESLLGAPHTVEGDVYALGVLLFQLVVADLTAPMGVGFGALVTDPLLRADIETMVDRDPARRLHSAAEAGERIRGLAARRERAEAQARFERERAKARRRRRVIATVAVSALLLAVIASWGIRQWRQIEHAQYLTHIDAARRAIEAEQYGKALGELERASARERGWEWYHLHLLANPALLETVGPHISVGADDRLAITATDEHGLVWPVRDARPLDGGEAFCFAESMPGGARVLTVPRATAGPPSVVVWDRASGIPVLRHPLRVSSVDHWNPVRMVDGCLPGIHTSYSADGSRVVLSGGNLETVVVDGGGSRARDLPVYASGVQLAPDGRTFAGIVGGFGGGVAIWDADAGARTASFPVEGLVRSISLQSDPDGHATGILVSDVRSVVLRDLATGRTIWAPKGEEYFAGWLAPEGRSALTQEFDGTVRVWDLSSGSVLASVAAPSGTSKLVFSKSGRMMLGASSYDEVWAWTIGAPQPMFIFRAGDRDAPVHKATAFVSHIELSDDGSKALVTSKPRGRSRERLHVLDTTERRGVHDVDRAIGEVDRSGRFGLVDDGESATIIDLSEALTIRELPAWNTDGGAAAWFVGDDEVMTLGRDGVVQVTSPTSDAVLRRATLSGFPKVSPRQFGLHMDAGKVFDSAMGLEERRALEERDSEGGPIDRFASKLAPKAHVRHAADRIAVSKGDLVRVWSAATGAEIAHIPMHGAAGFMLSPDGRRMLLDWTNRRSENKRLELWDVDGARLIHEIPCSTSLAPNEFSEDSRWLLTGCWAGSADVWDAQDGRHVRELRPIRGHLYDARFSRAAAMLVTISFDGPLQVWDVESSRAPLLLSSTDRYDTADISGDGRRVIAAKSNGSLVLWDASVGHELLSLEGAKGGNRVPWVRFLPDGKGILVVNDGRSRIWRVGSGSDGGQ